MPGEDTIDLVYRVLGYSGRPFLKHAWKKIIDSDISIVEAPTGYGKTVLSMAFSLNSVRRRFKTIVAYPLRTLLEDQYRKFSLLYKGLGAPHLVGTRYMYHYDSRYFVKPVSLTTIDTLSMTLFGLEPVDLEKALKDYYGASNYSLGHFLFSKASTILSDIALDEVHLLADTTKSLNFLASLLKIGLGNGSRILLLSATLPGALIESITGLFNDVRVVRFDESIDPEFTGDRRRKKYSLDVLRASGDKYAMIRDWLYSKIRDLGGPTRALLVFNTIREAVKMYRSLGSDDRFNGIKKILLHSRFSEADRQRKISELRKAVESGGDYIVVATQVIEAGVDISSNIFASDIAPANSLIQRMGRFLRYPGEMRGEILIWYDDTGREEDRYKVYDRELVDRTLAYLMGHGSVFSPFLPSGYSNLLDSVYSPEDYVIDLGEAEELASLIFEIHRPRRTVEKFLEMKGSFVREGLNIPLLIGCRDTCEGERILVDPKKMIVPVSVNFFRRLIDKNLVIGEAVVDDDGNTVCHGLDRSTLESLTRNRRKPLKLLSRILSSRFIGFVARVNYSAEEGLEA